MSILFKVPLEDHPRVCGEQNQLLMDQVPIPGSPPRVRGTVHLCARSRRRSRITPACAGNSAVLVKDPVTVKDHPRVCGEQGLIAAGMAYLDGSPPRVRGTGLPALETLLPDRITPACAGNRKMGTPRLYRTTDHPRVCGEQLKSHPKARPVLGSPPRVRGTATWPALICTDSRITPACAGNSFSSSLSII